MKKIYLLLLLLATTIFSFGQKNLTLLSNYSFAPGVTCAGIWHYNDNSGHEYALVGTSNGLTILDITNPASPQHVFDVPDSSGEWREVKVWGHYAYVSNEGQHTQGGGGISIIDMSNLPGTPVYKKYTGDGSIAGLISTAHTVQVADSFLYINGCRKPNGQYLLHGGTVICSLTDPWNPVFTGAYAQQYVHDCFVRGNTLITSEIFALPAGGFSIIDITNKANPIPLSFHDTPFKFNHNTWMSDDSHYLYTTDELNHAPLASYDISDAQNISGPLDKYFTNKNKVGEVHNVRVLNDFLINACYGDSVHTGSQVTLVDAAHPDNLIEVGDYQLGDPDTGLVISWDADPYTLSGNIIATDGYHGMFVFAPTYRRACYLEGRVTDSITNNPLNNVKVEILASNAVDSTLFTGDYKTGVADSGTYTVVFSKAGYNTKTITDIALKNGVLTSLNIKLWNGVMAVNENAIIKAPLYIYPNPINTEATVRIDPSLLPGDHLRLRLNDALGRTVREIADINETIIYLNRKGIANGTYTLQLFNKEEKIGDATLIFQ